MLEVLGDHRIVMRRMLERFLRKPETRFFADRAVPLAQFQHEAGIFFGTHDDAGETVILGGRADHCRSADVDLLDRLFGRHAVFLDRFFERVQIDDNKVDRLDMKVVKLFSVHGIVEHSEQCRVNGRMERLHSAIQYFREAGNLRNLFYGNIRGGQERVRSPVEIISTPSAMKF